ncbi:DUF2071 domain-containing protein [Mycolicibacterium moriokaense]|uniref:DUF2071 domain-containing protein n=1 Tax=Mycolicibacterium moriokaense TaxID=39691 RepID=UPI00389910A2
MTRHPSSPATVIVHWPVDPQRVAHAALVRMCHLRRAVVSTRPPRDAGRHGDRSTRFTRAVYGVPYTWAKMRVARRDDEISYHSVRRWPQRGLRNSLTARVGDDVSPTPLEVWLTARWGAHTRKAGRTWWVPNEHGPWPLREAEILELDDDLLVAGGVAVAGEPLRALFSPGVHARFGRPSIVK